MHRLLELARPFTPTDAAKLGVSRQRLRDLQRDGHVQRIARGWYALSALTDQPESLAVALAGAPADVVVTGAYAASVHGLLLPGRATGVELVLPTSAGPVRVDRNANARIARRVIPPQHIQLQGGVHFTSPAWTAVELALSQPLDRALIPLDSALRAGISREQLLDVIPWMRGRPGVRLLKQAVSEADGRAESALESRSRGLFLLHGLPRPELQFELRAENGQHVRLDFAWPKFRLGGEVDGLVKYDRPEVLRREKIREMQIRRMGLDIERWTQWDLDNDLGGLLARLTARILHVSRS